MRWCKGREAEGRGRDEKTRTVKVEKGGRKRWGGERGWRIRRRSVFPGVSSEFVFCLSQLACQQEALGSSWIRPSVRDLAADPENETTHTHTHTHTHYTHTIHTH